jgi:hypothetical protein
MRPLSVYHALLVVLTLLSTAWPAQAHRFHVSRSQWRILSTDGVLGVTLSISGEDLGRLQNRNEIPPVPGAKKRSQRQRVFQSVEKHLLVANNGKSCAPKPLRQSSKAGKYRIGLRFQCDAALGDLVIRFAFLPVMNAGHRHMVRLDVGGEKEERIFTRGSWRYTRHFKSNRKTPRVEPKPERAREENSSGDLMLWLLGAFSVAAVSFVAWKVIRR